MDLGSICLLFAYFFNFALSCQGTVIQSPLTACVGETVTVSCVLTPPDGQSFQASIPSFIVGIVAPSLSAVDINNNVSHGGIDLSRLAPTVNNSGISTRISGTLTLSYLPNDEGLLLGCSAPYFDSATMTNNLTVETIQLNQTEIPSSLSSTVALEHLNKSTCASKIRFKLDSFISTRSTNYSIIFNGSVISSNLSSSRSFPLYNTFLQPNMKYSTFFTLGNCAGINQFKNEDIYVNEYSLSKLVCGKYMENKQLDIAWMLNTPLQPTSDTEFIIVYDLSIGYSNTSTRYRLTDSVYPSFLTQHNFTANITSSHNLTPGTTITASLRIVEQCGQSISESVMTCQILVPSEGSISKETIGLICVTVFLFILF